MIGLYLRWLIDILHVAREDLIFSLYIHETTKSRLKEIIKEWSKATGFPKKKFSNVYYKRNKLRTIRKNIGENYFGLVRVRVRRSTNLNRRIMGWVDGIVQK